MAEHNELGTEGEWAAAEFLVKQGYNIKEMDWRNLHRDVDIIAEKHGLLVFVEVKTRRNEDFGRPEDNVSQKKLNSLLRAASNYIRINELNQAVRFDVISVVGENGLYQIRHIKNAFTATDWHPCQQQKHT